ncbi:Anti-sigma factor N-terminus [Natronincola peptidivorans]|uniref:Anti-sigma factor N-terminus n=1 Tax=Natronincola peptidivorans TaxID=426128 RepID=A0A1I0DYM8_9FIRM|nr:anti-sigma factor domain-containing protein [Natronincola peptidivorans]SET37843.1 Anti-sigma factor N-terminus [Natronincola peptidivorans]
MVYKGRIVDIEKDYAVVITSHIEYYKVVKKNDLYIGKQILFLDEDIYKEKKRSFIAFVGCAAIFIILLLFTTLIPEFQGANYTSVNPVAIISLDINPSVEYEIDKEGIVINIFPKNHEGALIVSQDMIGQEIKDVLYTSILNARNKRYITSDNSSVLIGIGILEKSFVMDLEILEKDIRDQINLVNDLNHISIISLKGNKSDIEASRQHAITLGKYKLYQKLLQNEVVLELEDVKSMKVKELLVGPMHQYKWNNGYQWRNKENAPIVEEKGLEIEPGVLKRQTQNQPNHNNASNSNNTTSPTQGNKNSGYQSPQMKKEGQLEYDNNPITPESHHEEPLASDKNEIIEENNEAPKIIPIEKEPSQGYANDLGNKSIDDRQSRKKGNKK